MKKTFSYLLMAMMTMVLSFAIQPDAQAQAGSIPVDIGLDKSRLHIMMTDTTVSTNDYRYGKSKWFDYDTARAEWLLSVPDDVTISTDSNIVIHPADNLLFLNIPTYADDTAAGAGGLTAGMVYKTSSGVLMIKL